MATTYGPLLRNGGVESDLRILSRTTGIDATSVATTNLYTVPTGKTCVVVNAYVRCTAVSGGSNPAGGIGVAAGESDIVPSIAFNHVGGDDPFQTVNDFRRLKPGDVSPGVWTPAVQVAAGSVIKLGIDTGATGGSMTIEVYLIGYLF